MTGLQSQGKPFLEAHRQEIAAVLQRAFLDDPIYRFLMPDVRRRPELLEWWMACQVRYGIRYGEIYTTIEPVLGAAIWLPPHRPLISVSGMALSGFIQAPLRLGPTGLRRTLAIDRLWGRLHAREPRRHWYLLAIGVEPAHQGKGIGSALIRPVLERADREGLPCYLETMTDADVRFYQKHGFDVVARGRLGGEAPYWTMRRTPAGI